MIVFGTAASTASQNSTKEHLAPGLVTTESYLLRGGIACSTTRRSTTVPTPPCPSLSSGFFGTPYTSAPRRQSPTTGDLLRWPKHRLPWGWNLIIFEQKSASSLKDLRQATHGSICGGPATVQTFQSCLCSNSLKCCRLKSAWKQRRGHDTTDRTNMDSHQRNQQTTTIGGRLWLLKAQTQ